MAKHPGVFERRRLIKQLPCCFGALALHLEAAKLRGPLRRQADMPHDGYARAHQRADLRQESAFELDGPDAAFPDKARPRWKGAVSGPGSYVINGMSATTRA